MEEICNESIRKQYDYLINNNGSLEDLFNECKLICDCL